MVGFFLQVFFEYVLPSAALVGLGGYLEYRFGSKVASRVAAVEAKVASVEALVKKV